jgi:hypothetical protein
MPMLERLNLSNNLLTDNAMETSQLERCGRLKSLVLADNHLGKWPKCVSNLSK